MVSHICSCGYASACPQPWQFAGVFTSLSCFATSQMYRKHVGSDRTDSGNCLSGQVAGWTDRGRVFSDFSGLPLQLVYRIVVVVNACPFLWIRPFFSTTSGVYDTHKPVGCSCMCPLAKMDNNSSEDKSVASSQSVPVDMQKLIHNG